jgi:hypothetical protein
VLLASRCTHHLITEFVTVALSFLAPSPITMICFKTYRIIGWHKSTSHSDALHWLLHCTGILCLVGLKGGDTAQDASVIADKILRMRLFPDPESGSNWKRNVVDIGGDILCISQFTLYCRVKRPAKPDFSRAMKTDEVRKFHENAHFLKWTGWNHCQPLKRCTCEQCQWGHARGWWGGGKVLLE